MYPKNYQLSKDILRSIQDMDILYNTLDYHIKLTDYKCIFHKSLSNL